MAIIIAFCSNQIQEWNFDLAVLTLTKMPMKKKQVIFVMKFLQNLIERRKKSKCYFLPKCVRLHAKILMKKNEHKTVFKVTLLYSFEFCKGLMKNSLKLNNPFSRISSIVCR